MAGQAGAVLCLGARKSHCLGCVPVLLFTWLVYDSSQPLCKAAAKWDVDTQVSGQVGAANGDRENEISARLVSAAGNTALTSAFMHSSAA